MSLQLRVVAASLAMIVGLAVTAQGDARATPVELLRQYLQIDTSNPPGNEHLAAAFLADRLHREGIETRLLISPQGRTNLYARIDGGPQAQGALVLMHHMDVVPPGGEWSVEPFAGELKDGSIWGPGAVDDKSLGIAHLLSFIERHVATETLRHDLIFLAVSDEETGGLAGTAWLLDRHPDLFADVVAVLTEGGSNRVFGGQTRWWGVEVAQKRPLWLAVTTEGRAGHGSSLDLNTAPNRLVGALGGLLELPRNYRVTAEARAYFEAIEQLAPTSDDSWLTRIEAAIASGSAERFLRPGQHNLFLDTIQITSLDSGAQVNAIPSHARALVDVRALPDTDVESLLDRIKAAVGSDARVEVLLTSPPAAPSPTDHEIWSCLERALGETAPVVPTFIASVTDARYFRQREIPAYGVSPFALGSGDAQGVHGIDERISEAAFERGVETMSSLVKTCTTE